MRLLQSGLRRNFQLVFLKKKEDEVDDGKGLPGRIMGAPVNIYRDICGTKGNAIEMRKTSLCTPGPSEIMGKNGKPHQYPQ